MLDNAYLEITQEEKGTPRAEIGASPPSSPILCTKGFRGENISIPSSVSDNSERQLKERECQTLATNKSTDGNRHVSTERQSPPMAIGSNVNQNNKRDKQSCAKSINPRAISNIKLGKAEIQTFQRQPKNADAAVIPLKNKKKLDSMEENKESQPLEDIRYKLSSCKNSSMAETSRIRKSGEVA